LNHLGSRQIDFAFTTQKHQVLQAMGKDSPARNPTVQATLGLPRSGVASTSSPVPIISMQTDSVGFSAAGEVQATENNHVSRSDAKGVIAGAGSSTSTSGSIAHEAAQQVPQRAITRAQRGINKTKVYTYGTIRYCFLTTIGEPTNLEDAL
jgi:hypothetical protein